MIWELYLLFLEKIYTVYFSVWFLNIAISSCHSTSLASNTRKRNGRKVKMAKITRFCIVTGSIRFILSRKKGKRERGPIDAKSLTSGNIRYEIGSSALKSSQSFDDGTRSRRTMLLIWFSSPRICGPTQGSQGTRTARIREPCRFHDRRIRLRVATRVLL